MNVQHDYRTHLKYKPTSDRSQNISDGKLGSKLPQQGPHHQLAGSVHPCLEEEVLLMCIDSRQFDAHLGGYGLVLLPADDQGDDLPLTQGEGAWGTLLAHLWLCPDQGKNLLAQTLGLDAIPDHLARRALNHPEDGELGIGREYQQGNLRIGKSLPLQGEQGTKVLRPAHKQVTIQCSFC